MLFISVSISSALAQMPNVVSNQPRFSEDNSSVDFTNHTVLNSSIGNLSNENKWINVTGMWILDEGGLNGGPLTNGSISPTNILLYPSQVENLSGIYTTFRINEINPETSNLASIIYQFENPDKYSHAGMNILNDTIYLSFWDYKDGILETLPPSPGVNTGLSFFPNSFYNLSIIKTSQGLNLLLNGSDYFTHPVNASGEPTYIGLHYGSLKNITFFEFASKSLLPDSLVNSINSAKEKSYSVSDSIIITLNGKELPENDYIPLYDSSPLIISKGIIQADFPCDEDNSTDINVLQGNGTLYYPITLNLVPNLNSESGQCHYEGVIQSNQTNHIDNILIHNNSTEDLEFDDNSLIFIKVSENWRK